MTNSNENNSDRLDRIEAIVESNSRAIAKNSQTIAENSQTIAENSQAIAENSQAIAQQRQSIEQQRQSIEQQRQSIEQLAQAAQAALSLAQNSRESLQQTDRMTRRNAAAIARLEEKMEQYIIEGKEHREFIATQVDGIKIETRRIIEHLFGATDSD